MRLHFSGVSYEEAFASYISNICASDIQRLKVVKQVLLITIRYLLYMKIPNVWSASPCNAANQIIFTERSIINLLHKVCFSRLSGFFLMLLCFYNFQLSRVGMYE